MVYWSIPDRRGTSSMTIEEIIRQKLATYNKAESLLENREFDQECYQDIIHCEGYEYFKKYQIKVRSYGPAYPCRVLTFEFEKFQDQDTKTALVITRNTNKVITVATCGAINNNTFISKKFYTFAAALSDAMKMDKVSLLIDYQAPQVKAQKIKFNKPLFETIDYQYISEPAPTPFTLRETIELVGNGRRGVNFRRNKHQRRVYDHVLKAYSAKLLLEESAISSSGSFAELYEITRRNKISGIGDLTCYDITLRLGYFLNLLPDEVFTHAGTYLGLQRLCGEIGVDFAPYKDRLHVKRDELPAILKDSDLLCPHIEDFLCRYDKNCPSINSLEAYPH